ncbi:MAG: DUF3106 domain-containing protein [Moraxellaceae bacterium]|nr:DUF3106 domain-containing protein [Moraxellaceae bacterium]
MATHVRARRQLILAGLAGVVVLAVALSIWLVQRKPATPPQTFTDVVLPAEESLEVASLATLKWKQLSAANRATLAPLAKEWDRLGDDRREKWLVIAARYDRLTPVEQQRMQDRMREWTRLSAVEREKARGQYKKLQTVSPQARRELRQKWEEYSALSPEDKAKLKTARATPSQPRQTAAAPMSPITAPTVQVPMALLVVPQGTRPQAPRPAPAVSEPQPQLLPQSEPAVMSPSPAPDIMLAPPLPDSGFLPTDPHQQ